jgi:hypothetical protein
VVTAGFLRHEPDQRRHDHNRLTSSRGRYMSGGDKVRGDAKIAERAHQGDQIAATDATLLAPLDAGGVPGRDRSPGQRGGPLGDECNALGK